MKITGLLLVCALTGCVGLSSVPQPGFDTPAAQLNDRLTSDDDDSNTRAFAVLDLDGSGVRNVISNSGRIGFGAAAGLVPYVVVRRIAIKPYQVHLAGRYLFVAPIDDLIRSARGRNQTVDGTVSFTPRRDHVYRVNGLLSSDESSVWIEDFETGEVVSEIVRHRE